MAIPALPDVLLTPVRGAGFIPAFTPAAAAQPASAAFATIVDNAVAGGAPLARGLAQAIPQVDAATFLDRAYLRDLVAGVRPGGGTGDVMSLLPSFTNDLGIEALLGRSGLPAAINQLDSRQALGVYAAALELFSMINALGSEDTAEGPPLGALLDITA